MAPMMANGCIEMCRYAAMPRQEKRMQALLGSNLPRNILVSDVTRACQPLAEVLGQGLLLGTGTLDIGAMPP